MLGPEAPLEATARNVIAAVTAALGPGAMLGAPVVRAMVLPALVARPATLALPAAVLMPLARFVGRAPRRRVPRTRGRGAAAPAAGGGAALRGWPRPTPAGARSALGRRLLRTRPPAPPGFALGGRLVLRVLAASAAEAVLGPRRPRQAERGEQHAKAEPRP